MIIAIVNKSTQFPELTDPVIAEIAVAI